MRFAEQFVMGVIASPWYDDIDWLEDMSRVRKA